jgi:repressor LexA
MQMEPRRRGRPPAAGLTEPQLRTLREIRNCIVHRGYPPTLQELAELLGITSASTYDQVNHLVRKGYLKREPRKARGLSVARIPDGEVSDVIAVPIVGEVAAGPAMLAEENIVGEVLVESRIAGRGRCFALRVKGDSMIGANIRNGDLVIVRQQPAADSGDVVVALLGSDATVKRLHISEEGVELRPENPKHRAIHVGPEEDMRIAGKVVAVRRHG